MKILVFSCIFLELESVFYKKYVFYFGFLKFLIKFCEFIDKLCK